MKTGPLLISILLATPAFAQPAAPPPSPPPPPVAAPEAAPPTPPPPVEAAPPATTEAAPPPVDPTSPAALAERIAELEGKIEGMNESTQATSATVNALAKIKVSGYIQGRFAWREDSNSGVDAAGRVTNFDRFLVRRGRLKTVYAGENAEYLLQLDATGDGVVMKDAEATFVDTWSPLGFRFTMGQFKVPFGYEVLQSSSDREMPERAAVIRALFPGERDRGVRLTGRWEWMKFMAALVNGNFTQGDAVFNPTSRDNNRFADTYVRVIGDFDFLVVGLSGQYGQKVAATVNTTISDRNMNGVIDATDITPIVGQSLYNLWRVGADAQLYFDIPGLGGLALKGELVLGRETNQDFRGTAANSCLDKKQLGWIATGVQNIGDHLGVVVRIDQYDPNRDVTGASCTAAMVMAAQTDRQTTYGFGLLGYASGNLKASLTYEKVSEQANPKDNDVFTAQLQARF